MVAGRVGAWVRHSGARSSGSGAGARGLGSAWTHKGDPVRVWTPLGY